MTRPVPRGRPVGWARLPTAVDFPVHACRRQYPGGVAGRMFRSLPQRQPSPFQRRVSPPHHPFRGLLSVHYTLQPACSPSHQGDPLHRRLQPFRRLHDRSDCYRLERKLPGGSVPHWEIAPLLGARRRWVKIAPKGPFCEISAGPWRPRLAGIRGDLSGSSRGVELSLDHLRPKQAGKTNRLRVHSGPVANGSHFLTMTHSFTAAGARIDDEL
jgi:hypothetical protein